MDTVPIKRPDTKAENVTIQCDRCGRRASMALAAVTGWAWVWAGVLEVPWTYRCVVCLGKRPPE